jgi:hypothetical protein
MSFLLAICGVSWLLSVLLSVPIYICYSAAVFILTAISSSFYVNSVDFQNNNTVGWIFFPATVSAVLTGDYFLKNGSPEDCWERSLKSVSVAVINYRADYVIVCRNTDVLYPGCEKARYRVVSYIDWKYVIGDIGEQKPLKLSSWWILKRETVRGVK